MGYYRLLVFLISIQWTGIFNRRTSLIFHSGSLAHSSTLSVRFGFRWHFDYPLEVIGWKLSVGSEVIWKSELVSLAGYVPSYPVSVKPGLDLGGLSGCCLVPPLVGESMVCMVYSVYHVGVMVK